MTNTTIQLASFCVTKLAEHDIEAFIECGESTDGEVVLHIPALEDEGCLSQPSVYRLISELLEVQDGAGLMIRNPVNGQLLGIFCYSPGTFVPAGDGADVEFWQAAPGKEFRWSELADSACDWFEGWPVPGSEIYGQRISFLAALFLAQRVQLPLTIAA